MKRYFLFEPNFITKSEGVSLTFNEVKKDVTAAQWVDPYSRVEGSDIPDWEHQVSIMYPYVIYDEHGVSVDGVSPAPYKLWYFAKAVKNPVTPYNWLNNIIDKENSRNVELGTFKNTARGTIRTPDSVLCYMESSNGITWRRPDCGEFYYKTPNGSIVGTNLVFIGEHGMGVCQNAHPEAGKTEPRFLFGCGGKGVGFSWSNNGIHWETPVHLITEWGEAFRMPGDTHNQLIWSPERERYVIITRGFEGDVRMVVALWAEGVTSLHQIIASQTGKTEEENRCLARAFFSDPLPVLKGTMALQPYSMPIAQLEENCYIGVVSMSNFEENTAGHLHVYASLATSTNGIAWEYLCNGAPFIANAPSFALEAGNDYGMIFAAAPVRVGENTKIFYAATPELHYFSYDQIPAALRTVVDEKIPKAKAAGAITRTTALNVATFPCDCFVGFGGVNGTLLTRPLPLTAAPALGVSVANGGFVTAALCDENGNPLTGFSHNDFMPLTQTGAYQPLVWNTPLSALNGQTVSLELRLHNATAYALQL